MEAASALARGRAFARRPLVRAIALLLLAFAFGVASTAFRGGGTGVRDALGSLSAPWLIVSLLAGAWAGGGRIGRGAVLGLAAALAAVAGLYVANAFASGLGSHAQGVELELTLGAAIVLAERGALTGLLMGAFGAFSQRRHPALVGWIAASILMLEPVAQVLDATGRRAALDGFAITPVLAGEAALGCALAATNWLRARRRRTT